MKTAMTAAAVLAMSGAAMADDLLLVDLTVPNQITISATAGLSSADASFSSFTGVYLDGAFGADGFFSAVLDSGDLTTFNDPSDNSPSLFRGGSGTDPGLNIWSFSSNTNVSMTAGVQGFAGSATWTLDPEEYNALLAGAGSGNIYAGADTFDDLSTATLVGTWTTVGIPAPGAAGLLGLAGLAAVRRRR